jgi:hypothetical protein
MFRKIPGGGCQICRRPYYSGVVRRKTRIRKRRILRARVPITHAGDSGATGDLFSGVRSWLLPGVFCERQRPSFGMKCPANAGSGTGELECGASCGAAVRHLASFSRPSFAAPAIFVHPSLERNARFRPSTASLRDPSVAKEPASNSDSTLGIASVGSLIGGGEIFQGGLSRREAIRDG